MDLHDVDVILLLYYQYVIYFYRIVSHSDPAILFSKAGRDIFHYCPVKPIQHNNVPFWHDRDAWVRDVRPGGGDDSRATPETALSPGSSSPERTALLASASAGGVFV
jgi:hypothetical protein